MPDGIATYTVNGTDYIVIANRVTPENGAATPMKMNVTLEKERLLPPEKSLPKTVD